MSGYKPNVSITFAVSSLPHSMGIFNHLVSDSIPPQVTSLMLDTTLVENSMSLDKDILYLSFNEP